MSFMFDMMALRHEYLKANRSGIDMWSRSQATAFS